MYVCIYVCMYVSRLLVVFWKIKWNLGMEYLIVSQYDNDMCSHTSGRDFVYDNLRNLI